MSETTPDMQTHYDKTKPVLNQVQDETMAGVGADQPRDPLLKQANSGGIIDNSIQPTKPVYTHAGSMGGQNTWDCDLCGATIRDTFQTQHDAFHAQVAGVLRYTGVR